MKISRSGKIDDVGKKGDNWGNDFLWIEWRYVERNSEKKLVLLELQPQFTALLELLKL